MPQKLSTYNIHILDSGYKLTPKYMVKIPPTHYGLSRLWIIPHPEPVIPSTLCVDWDTFYFN